MVPISEERLKHLEFLQNVIMRMAGNSMAAKGWSVALTTAFVALAAADKAQPRFVLLAMVPVLAFWAIDGYYLYLEGGYRDRFDAVKKATDASWTGFEMSAMTGRSYVSDGLFRPAVFVVHLLVLLLAGGAWLVVK